MNNGLGFKYYDFIRLCYGTSLSLGDEVKMIDAKITETRYYDQHGNKKVALLEKGQGLRIDSLYRFDEYHFENVYLCKVINPSDQSKDYGVRDGMIVEVYSEYLEVA